MGAVRVLNTIHADTVASVFREGLQLLLSNGIRAGARRQRTRELVSLVLRADDPHQRFLSPAIADYPTIVMKQLQWLAGLVDIDALRQRDPTIDNRLDPESGLYDGAYGPRLKPQMRRAYDLLQSDPSSRRAVVAICTPADRVASLDLPSTMCLQFLLRQNRLNAITYMRSNDYWGGFPTDCHLFCLLQEVMAAWLNVGLGEYIHVAGSAHIYEQDLTAVHEYLSDPAPCIDAPPRFSASQEATDAQVSALLNLDRTVRRGRTDSSSPGALVVEDGYLKWCQKLILEHPRKERNA